MLLELRIENLLLIERAEFALDRGLNVITGETGAGKTMLAHAIDLLLGGKSRRGIVRPGAREAYVEGLFALPEGLLETAEFAALRDRLADPECGEIALARRVTPEGRTRAYIEGRSATAADLRLLGGALVAFYGQHEHRKLTLAGAQQSVLDDFAAGLDGAHRGRLADLATLHAQATRLSSELTELEVVDGRRERELGLIEFELAEIEELGPDPAEHDDLVSERGRLRAVDRLRLAAAGALSAIDDDESGASGGGVGAAASVATAVSALQSADGADAALDALAQRADALSLELQDLGADLRAYAASLTADPERLAFVEDRLDAYERLKRKHGGDVEAVLAHAERCREDRARLSGAGEQIAELGAELERVRKRQRTAAAKVSATRRKAATRLDAAVRERLSELAMEGATFESRLTPLDGEVRATGTDHVEFLISANPGISPTALRETASGGELSRVMLALLTAGRGFGSASAAGGTLVFDEIDAGIGGHTARAVGDLLRELGESYQVICITHLPQVAATAHRHFRIVKTSTEQSARTDIHQLVDDEVVDELCRMLGADAGDAGAREHASALLAA